MYGTVMGVLIEMMAMKKKFLVLAFEGSPFFLPSEKETNALHTRDVQRRRCFLEGGRHRSGCH